MSATVPVLQTVRADFSMEIQANRSAAASLRQLIGHDADELDGILVQLEVRVPPLFVPGIDLNVVAELNDALALLRLELDRANRAGFALVLQAGWTRARLQEHLRRLAIATAHLQGEAMRRTPVSSMQALAIHVTRLVDDITKVSLAQLLHLQLNEALLLGVVPEARRSLADTGSVADPWERQFWEMCHPQYDTIVCWELGATASAAGDAGALPDVLQVAGRLLVQVRARGDRGAGEDPEALPPPFDDGLTQVAALLGAARWRAKQYAHLVAALERSKLLLEAGGSASPVALARAELALATERCRGATDATVKATQAMEQATAAVETALQGAAASEAALAAAQRAAQEAAAREAMAVAAAAKAEQAAATHAATAAAANEAAAHANAFQQAALRAAETAAAREASAQAAAAAAQQAAAAHVAAAQAQAEAAQRVSAADVNVLEAFKCPITTAILRNPVQTVMGHTYELASIKAWLQNRSTDPFTGQTMTDLTLRPNHALRIAIEEWLSAHGLTHDEADNLLGVDPPAASAASATANGSSAPAAAGLPFDLAYEAGGEVPASWEERADLLLPAEAGGAPSWQEPQQHRHQQQYPTSALLGSPRGSGNYDGSGAGAGSSAASAAHNGSRSDAVASWRREASEPQPLSARASASSVAVESVAQTDVAAHVLSGTNNIHVAKIAAPRALPDGSDPFAAVVTHTNKEPYIMYMRPRGDVEWVPLDNAVGARATCLVACPQGNSVAVAFDNGQVWLQRELAADPTGRYGPPPGTWGTVLRVGFLQDHAKRCGVVSVLTLHADWLYLGTSHGWVARYPVGMDAGRTRISVNDPRRPNACQNSHVWEADEPQPAVTALAVCTNAVPAAVAAKMAKPTTLVMAVAQEGGSLCLVYVKDSFKRPKPIDLGADLQCADGTPPQIAFTPNGKYLIVLAAAPRGSSAPAPGEAVVQFWELNAARDLPTPDKPITLAIGGGGIDRYMGLVAVPGSRRLLATVLHEGGECSLVVFDMWEGTIHLHTRAKMPPGMRPECFALGPGDTPLLAGTGGVATWALQDGLFGGGGGNMQ